MRRADKRTAMQPQGSCERFESSARTHVGTVRSVNEDRFLARDDIRLWAVADGMGGHLNGDVAAETVIEALGGVQNATADAVRAAIACANRKLFDAAEGSVDRASGATVVALLLGEGRYECLWAGDSEVWRLRGGALAKLTRDHSVVEELVEAGLLAEADRRSHPQANIITRAIGVDDVAMVDSVSGECEPGDLFLICSDGLTGAVAKRELEAIVSTGSLDVIADALLDRALANHASDNVTFILVRGGKA